MRHHKHVADWSVAASHLHANRHHVTQLLGCVVTGTFTVGRGRFHLVIEIWHTASKP